MDTKSELAAASCWRTTGAVGGAALLLVVTLLFVHFRRRQRSAPMPSRNASIPYLKSSDERLYFRLEGLDQNGVIIGRGKHGVDLIIEESTLHADTVSNKHARIFYDKASGHVIIEDLGSTNGIFINGRQAPRRNLLKESWVVGLGRVTMTYHDGEADTGPLD